MKKNMHDEDKEISDLTKGSSFAYEQKIEAFGKNRLVFGDAQTRADDYIKRGADWAMPHKEPCEKVRREVYFLDYSLKDEDRYECMEWLRCPAQKACKRYNRDPFGKRRTTKANVIPAAGEEVKEENKQKTQSTKIS